MRAIAAACFCAALLGACSSGNGSSSSTVPTSPIGSAQHRTPAACVLVQPADATNLFARTATAVVVQNSSHAQSVCGFSADTRSDKNAIDNVNYSLLTYVYDGTKQYSSAAGTKGTKVVRGVGDKAFTALRDNLLTLAFVKNGETVVLAYAITGLANHQKAGAARNDLIALAKNAASRM